MKSLFSSLPLGHYVCWLFVVEVLEGAWRAGQSNRRGWRVCQHSQTRHVDQTAGRRQEQTQVWSGIIMSFVCLITPHHHHHHQIIYSAPTRACKRSGAGRFAAPSLKPFLLHPAPRYTLHAPAIFQRPLTAPLRSGANASIMTELQMYNFMKFCRRENFNEQFHKNLMKFKKN